MAKKEIKFLVDRMLGKLAKYLLMLGVDTLYFNQNNRVKLIEVAIKQGRVIISRDIKLKEVYGFPDVWLVNDDLPENQLRQVVQDFRLVLEKDHFFKRCLRCNQKLVEKTPEEVQDIAPPYVVATQEKFAFCPQCKRVYWRGSHFKKMEKIIKKVLY